MRNVERRKRILFADNHLDFLRTRAKYLERQGWEVTLATSPGEARRALEDHWFHIAIIDARLQDDNDLNDVSGLTLANDERFSSIPKIIHSLYVEDSGEFRVMEAVAARGVRVVPKRVTAERLVEVVKDDLRERVRINWDLRLRFGPGRLSCRRIAELIEPASIAFEEKAEELEDLLRRLFYDKDEIVVERVLWTADARVALAVSANTAIGGFGFFVLICGNQDRVIHERSQFKTNAPPAQGETATVLALMADTTHLAANAYAIDAEPEEVTPLRDVYLRESDKPFHGTLATLFSKTLARWHRNIRQREERSLDDLYLDRLHLKPDWARELMRRIDFVIEESQRLNSPIIRFENSLVIGGTNLGFPNLTVPADEASTAGNPVRVSLAPGALSGENILADTSGRAWVTDFYEAGLAPVAWNCVSVEAIIRFDWGLGTTDLKEIYDFESRLAGASELGEIDWAGTSRESRKALQAIQEVRKIAVGIVSADFSSYHRGLFFHAVRRLLDIDMQASLRPGTLARLFPALIAVCRLSAGDNQPKTDFGIRIDKLSHRAWVSGREVSLTPHLFSILLCLYEKGGVCTREEIFESVYPGQKYRSERSQDLRLNKAMYSLRELIGEQFLESRSGLGYTLRTR